MQVVERALTFHTAHESANNMTQLHSLIVKGLNLKALDAIIELFACFSSYACYSFSKNKYKISMDFDSALKCYSNGLTFMCLSFESVLHLEL